MEWDIPGRSQMACYLVCGFSGIGSIPVGNILLYVGCIDPSKTKEPIEPRWNDVRLCPLRLGTALPASPVALLATPPPSAAPLLATPPCPRRPYIDCKGHGGAYGLGEVAACVGLGAGARARGGSGHGRVAREGGSHGGARGGGCESGAGQPQLLGEVEAGATARGNATGPAQGGATGRRWPPARGAGWRRGADGCSGRAARQDVEEEEKSMTIGSHIDGC